MVRLKVKSVVNNLYTRSNISIPYGAIKSIGESGIRCVALSISIPYGAIKSIIMNIN